MIRVGITLPPYNGRFRGDQQILWGSGLYQNIVFLHDALNMAHEIKAYVVGNYSLAKFLNLNHADGSIKLDVIIELGATLQKDQALQWRRSGRKLISHPIGNVMFLNLDSMTGRGNTWHVPPNTYDSVWLLPHFWNTNAGFASMTGHSIVEKVPMVWDPRFVDGVKYVPQKSKRVGMFEPSVSAVKTPHVPIMVAARCSHMGEQSLIDHIDVYAAKPVQSLVSLVGAVGSRAPIHFLPRKSPQEAFRDLSAVVSHTMENGLNYNWFELVHAGFPLLHNSQLFGAGYKYPTFDVESGSSLLYNVLLRHDDHRNEYAVAAERFLTCLRPKEVAPQYENLIKRVL